jgi:hypothetical protein
MVNHHNGNLVTTRLAESAQGDRSMAAMRRARGQAGGARWAWEEDELTLDIVRRLRSGEVLETRQFLKPIFRYV